MVTYQFFLKFPSKNHKFHKKSQLNSPSSAFFTIDAWNIEVQWFHILRANSTNILRKPMKTWNKYWTWKLKSYNASRDKNKLSPWWWSKLRSSSRDQIQGFLLRKLSVVMTKVAETSKPTYSYYCFKIIASFLTIINVTCVIFRRFRCTKLKNIAFEKTH